MFRVDKVNISTGAVELLTQIPAQLNFPRMSPDGRYLYALINWGLFRIDLRTKERVRSVSVDDDIRPFVRRKTHRICRA